MIAFCQLDGDHLFNPEKTCFSGLAKSTLIISKAKMLTKKLKTAATPQFFLKSMAPTTLHFAES